MSTSTGASGLDDHRAFLNRYYGWSRRIYDVTRRYYLFGRDVTLDRLLGEPWDRLVEIGPGTGRNLRYLHRRRPAAALGGVEASDAMLEHARRACPFAALQHGFAETARYEQLLGAPPDRVLFSYCLSMVQDPATALDRALESVGARGEVWVVDFADLYGLPRTLASWFRGYLARFHVQPLSPVLFAGRDAQLDHGPGRYWVLARLRPRSRR